MHYLSSLTGHLSQWIFVGVVLVVVLILNRIVHAIVATVGKHLPRAKDVWIHAFVTAIDAPLRVFIWMFGAALVFQHFFPLAKNPRVATTFPSALHVLMIVIVAWYLLRVIKRVMDNHVARAEKQEQDFDRTAIDAIGKVSWVMVLIFTAMTILQTLHIPLSGLLAFGGAAGIAVGFAARSLVANLFGGLTVFASRIFKIGEDIILPGTQLAGTIEKIGWRSTRVRGWDGKPFFVPNSYFNESTVINHQRMSHRRISESIQLRYEDFDKVEGIIRQGNELLATRQDIGYYMFRFDSFGDNALKLSLYAYSQNGPEGGFLPYAEHMRIKEEVLFAIAQIILETGCRFVLPLNYYARENTPQLAGPGEGMDRRLEAS